MELVLKKKTLNVFYGSDFHSDFWKYGFGPFFDYVNIDNYDLFIFAGDVGEWCDDTAREIYERLLYAGKIVVVIPGNHEFYSMNYQVVMEQMEGYAERNENFYFLNRNYLDLPTQQVRIWGDIFWTDFRGDAEARSVAKRRMNDYRKITFQRNTGGVLLEPEDTVVMHDKARTALKRDYQSLPEGWSFLVVTHHAPFPMSTPKQYRMPEYMEGAKMNKAYSSDLYEWCRNEDVYPDFWIHGHIHDPVHYEVEFDDAITTVISNPFGYPGERDHRTISQRSLKFSENGILLV